jgi:hypothetical protein
MRLQTANRVVLGVLISCCLFTEISPAQKQLFTITISAADTVTAGNAVVVRVALKNVSDHKIQVVSGNQYTVLVRDQNGKVLPERPGDWVGSTGWAYIDPGMVYEERLDVNLWYDLSNPGKYTVELSRPLDDENPKKGVVHSNEITIISVPGKEDKCHENCKG